MIMVIDAGHGGDDDGIVANGIKESHYTYFMARALRTMLAPWPIEIEYTRTLKNQTLDLTARAEYAKMINADFVLSLHVNAGQPDWHGMLTFYRRGDEIAGDVAHTIGNRAPYGVARGKSARTVVYDDPYFPRVYHALDNYHCAAVLVELGYATNPHEAAYIKTQYGMCGLLASLSAGVARAMELTEKKGSKKNEST